MYIYINEQEYFEGAWKGVWSRLSFLNNAWEGGEGRNRGVKVLLIPLHECCFRFSAKPW